MPLPCARRALQTRANGPASLRRALHFRCFAAALAIIAGTICSVPIFAFQLRPSFLLGATSTVAATVLYARAPPCSCIDSLLHRLRPRKPTLYAASAEERQSLTRDQEV